MSEFVIIETEMTDVDCLVQAPTEVKARGGRCWTRDMIEVHDKPVALYGYGGDARTQVAEIVVRRKWVGGSSNDIGFQCVDGKLVAHVSKYDLRQYGEAWQSAVAQRYGVNVVKTNAVASGYTSISEEVDAEGLVHVTVGGWR